MDASTDAAVPEPTCAKESRPEEESEHGAGQGPVAAEGNGKEQPKRGKKRKFALFLGYVGAGYSVRAFPKSAWETGPEGKS
jgi:hypothetical protein